MMSLQPIAQRASTCHNSSAPLQPAHPSHARASGATCSSYSGAAEPRLQARQANAPVRASPGAPPTTKPRTPPTTLPPQRPRTGPPTHPAPHGPVGSPSAQSATGKVLLQGQEHSLQTGLALTWLGTSSGSPSANRNVSCTLVRLPTATFMVDCGEGSHRQLLTVGADLARIDKIFVTHLHGDHCFGLGATLPLLDSEKARHQPDPLLRRNHVCGPPGLADLLRAALVLTGISRHLQLPLTITEFVNTEEEAHAPRPLDSAGKVMIERQAPKRIQQSPDLTAASQAVLPRINRLQEIWHKPHARNTTYSHTSANGPDNDEEGDGPDGGATEGLKRGVWVAQEGLFWEVHGNGVLVRAAQLQHRVPCVGYALTEVEPVPGSRRRKAVVMGDTVSSRAMAPLAAGCDVLSHEATFAQGMEDKARIAQHSTGWMAGAYAAAVGARQLVLTHFSARYLDFPNPVNRSGRELPESVLAQMDKEQHGRDVALLISEAAKAYGHSDRVKAAGDFYTFHVPLRP